MEQPSVNDVIINTCYMTVLSVELMMREVLRRLETEGATVKQEKKQNFSRFIDHCKKALFFAEELTQDIYEVDSVKGWKTIPVWQEESNELARLILLYADKSADVDNVNKVFKLLRELPGPNIITEDELKRFYLKKLEDE